MFYVQGISYLRGIEVARFSQSFTNYLAARTKALELNRDYPDMVVVVEFNHVSALDTAMEYYPIAKTGSEH